jgi:hypothetical protein
MTREFEALAQHAVWFKAPTRKDYLDLDALISHGVSLPEALAAARAIYGEKFNAQLTLKALSFFGDGDLPSLGQDIQQRLRSAVRATDLDYLPVPAAPLSPIGA